MQTRLASLLACLLLAQTVLAARKAPELSTWLKKGNDVEGYGNYRHQADVAHAYQVLLRGGLKAEHIITLMFDDIAHNPENPHKGQLYNRPGGEDVYSGVKIDYTGQRVNAKNFLAVLAGEQNATDNQQGRVLENTPQDRVFVYFSDHGAPGVLGMPSGPFLYADQLNQVLTQAAKKRKFKEMVLYIEACESGSIFEGLLESDLEVYATTAANGRESSWGTYCPGMNPSPPPEFNTCLGDLYSVAWLENSDRNDLNEETLKKQYQLVKTRTSNNYTYVMGSHVMRFGTLDIDEEPAANFLGEDNTGDGSLAGNDAAAWTPLEAVPQRGADLLHLYTKYTRATGADKSAALRALDAEVAKRAALDRSMHAAVSALVQKTALTSSVQTKYGEGLLGAGASSAALVSLLVDDQLPRQPGTALVQDWDCLRGMVAAWESGCGTLDQYGMQYTRTFANLCNAGVEPAALAGASHEACTAQGNLVGPQVHQVASS
ncbi:hypothetical protein N2152v2_006150 [Parachlorella kessleri]